MAVKLGHNIGLLLTIALLALIFTYMLPRFADIVLEMLVIVAFLVILFAILESGRLQKVEYFGIQQAKSVRLQKIEYFQLPEVMS